jgi:hypothetical protein
MQINVKETVVDKRCIEFIANHIAQYGDDPSTWSTWRAALKAAEPVQQTANTTQAEILLLRVTDHLDEIKFGCLHGLREDLKRYRAKHSAVR